MGKYIKNIILIYSLTCFMLGCIKDTDNILFEIRAGWYDHKFDYCTVDFRLCKLEGKFDLKYCIDKQNKCIRQITKYYRKVQLK